MEAKLQLHVRPVDALGGLGGYGKRTLGREPGGGSLSVGFGNDLPRDLLRKVALSCIDGRKPAQPSKRERLKASGHGLKDRSKKWARTSHFEHDRTTLLDLLLSVAGTVSPLQPWYLRAVREREGGDRVGGLARGTEKGSDRESSRIRSGRSCLPPSCLLEGNRTTDRSCP